MDRARRPDPDQILGQPAAYGSGAGRVDVFVRGTDNHAYQRTFNGTTWGRWINLGGTLTDSPTVAFTSPTAVDPGRPRRRRPGLARGPTGSWTSLGAPNSKPIYGRPSAVTDANGTLRRRAHAFDDRSGGCTGHQRHWSAWTALGGVISGSPTLLATDGRRLPVRPGQ